MKIADIKKRRKELEKVKTQRRALGTHIGEVVTKILAKKEIKTSDFADLLYKQMNLTKSSTASFICDVRHGYGNQYLPLNQEKSRGLEKLSVLLYHLGMDEKHELIETLRSAYSNFAYPPVNYK